MSARIRVERFRPNQLGHVLAIEEAAFPREAYPAGMFLDLHRKCGSLFYIVKHRRSIVGYMVTCVARGQAEIVSIASDPEYRGRGVGTALMRRTLRRLKQLGIPRVKLMVRTTNIAAMAFYDRFKFRRIRSVPGYYDDGGDGFLYALRLRD